VGRRARESRILTLAGLDKKVRTVKAPVQAAEVVRWEDETGPDFAPGAWTTHLFWFE